MGKGRRSVSSHASRTSRASAMDSDRVHNQFPEVAGPIEFFMNAQQSSFQAIIWAVCRRLLSVEHTNKKLTQRVEELEGRVSNLAFNLGGARDEVSAPPSDDEADEDVPRQPIQLAIPPTMAMLARVEVTTPSSVATGPAAGAPRERDPVPAKVPELDLPTDRQPSEMPDSPSSPSTTTLGRTPPMTEVRYHVLKPATNAQRRWWWAFARVKALLRLNSGFMLISQVRLPPEMSVAKRLERVERVANEAAKTVELHIVQQDSSAGLQALQQKLQDLSKDVKEQIQALNDSLNTTLQMLDRGAPAPTVQADGTSKTVVVEHIDDNATTLMLGSHGWPPTAVQTLQIAKQLRVGTGSIRSSLGKAPGVWGSAVDENADVVSLIMAPVLTADAAAVSALADLTRTINARQLEMRAVDQSVDTRRVEEIRTGLLSVTKQAADLSQKLNAYVGDLRNRLKESAAARNNPDLAAAALEDLGWTWGTHRLGFAVEDLVAAIQHLLMVKWPPQLESQLLTDADSKVLDAKQAKDSRIKRGILPRLTVALQSLETSALCHSAADLAFMMWYSNVVWGQQHTKVIMSHQEQMRQQLEHVSLLKRDIAHERHTTGQLSDAVQRLLRATQDANEGVTNLQLELQTRVTQEEMETALQAVSRAMAAAEQQGNLGASLLSESPMSPLPSAPEPDPTEGTEHLHHQIAQLAAMLRDRATYDDLKRLQAALKASLAKIATAASSSAAAPRSFSDDVPPFLMSVKCLSCARNLQAAPDASLPHSDSSGALPRTAGGSPRRSRSPPAEPRPRSSPAGKRSLRRLPGPEDTVASEETFDPIDIPQVRQKPLGATGTHAVPSDSIRRSGSAAALRAAPGTVVSYQRLMPLKPTRLLNRPA